MDPTERVYCAAKFPSLVTPEKDTGRIGEKRSGRKMRRYDLT